MAKVSTPVEGFNGIVAGVTFTDGQGETDNEGSLAYFARHGYRVEAKGKGRGRQPAKPAEGDGKKGEGKSDPAQPGDGQADQPGDGK